MNIGDNAVTHIDNVVMVVQTQSTKTADITNPLFLIMLEEITKEVSKLELINE